MVFKMDKERFYKLYVISSSMLLMTLKRGIPFSILSFLLLILTFSLKTISIKSRFPELNKSSKILEVELIISSLTF